MKPISEAQRNILLCAGLLAPAAELLPSMAMGQPGTSWLTVLLGGALAFLLLTLLLRPEQAPLDSRDTGPKQWVLIIYKVWFEFLLGVQLAGCAHRLLSFGERDGSPLFFLAVLTLIVLYLERSTLPAFARAGQIFFAVLLVSAGFVLLLSLPNTRPERLIPVTLPGLSPVLGVSGLLCWGLPAVFLPVSRKQTRSGPWLWSGTALLLLTASQMVILAGLGPGLAARVEYPFFSLAESVGIEGAFQRIESLVSSLWVFADLCLCGLLIFARKAINRQKTEKENRWTGAILILVAAVFGYWMLNRPEILLFVENTVVPIGNLLFTIELFLLRGMRRDRA